MPHGGVKGFSQRSRDDVGAEVGYKYGRHLTGNGKTRASRAARGLFILASRLAAERAQVHTKVCKGAGAC